MSTRTYYSSFYPSETAAGSKGSAAFLSNTNTFIVYLYRRSATVLLDADKPDGDVIYTFNTGNINISAVTNGWSATVPTGTDALYLVGATATGTDPEDTILTNEWTTPALLGSAGTNGLSNATIFLFQRNNTGIAPAVPSTATTYTFATGILSGTYTGWSQTAPDSAGGKYLFITTATAISATATDTIDNTEWATVRILAQDGADGYTAYLTNESHTVPATFAGVVSAYTGAVGNFVILKNGTDVSSNFTLSIVSNPQTLTVAFTNTGVGGVNRTYTISGGLDSVEDSASLTIRATGSGTYAGVTIDKVFSLGKSKGGADGSAAKLMVIYSDKQAFTLNGSGAYVPSGQYITFTATKQNTTAVVNWSTSPAVTIKDTSGNPTTTGDTVRLYATDTGANTAIEVTATLTDGTTITDKITIVKVQDGAAGTDAVTGYLTNESFTLTGDATGVVTDFSPGSGNFKVFKGTTDITSLCTFSRINDFGLATTMVTGPSATGGTYTVTAISGSVNYADFTAVTPAPNSVTITKRLNASVAKTGTTGTPGTPGANGNRTAKLEVYQWATTIPTSYPSGTSTYTWSTGTFTAPSTANGWTLLPGTGSGNQTLWAIQVIITDTGITTTSTATWNSTTVYAVGGYGPTGTAGITGMLTSDTVNVFTYADGTPAGYTSTAGYFRIFSGNAEVTAAATGFSVVASGCSGTVNTADNVPVNGAVKGYYIMSAMTADTATLTLSATYSGTTITKVFTVTKSKAGYEIVSANLPTVSPAGNVFVGRTVFNTLDNKLWRYTSTGWTTAVPATDISGLLQDNQINTLGASKLTGTLSADRIAANSLVAGKLYAGAVMADRIQATNIATNAITADAILAGEITAGKLGVNSVVANNIAAQAVTTAKLTIQNRNISLPYIRFKAKDGTLQWCYTVDGTNAGGYIVYIDDNGTQTNVSITAGSTTLTNVYVYWVQGATTFSVNASAATALAGNNVLLGWYNGSDEWYPTYGETIVGNGFIQTSSINASKIVTNSITADKMSVGSLSAITATIGTLRTATTGARTEIKDNLIQVYDASNVLRVRMGIW